MAFFLQPPKVFPDYMRVVLLLVSGYWAMGLPGHVHIDSTTQGAQSPENTQT